GVITDTIWGTGWAGQIGGGDAEGGNFIKIQAAVSNDAGAAYSAHLAPQNSGDTYWHVTAVGGIAWTQAFMTIVGAGYGQGLNIGAAGATKAFEASAEADWTIAKGVITGIAVNFVDPDPGSSETEVQWRTKIFF